MNKGTYQYELFKQIIHDAKKNEIAFSEGNDYYAFALSNDFAIILDHYSMDYEKESVLSDLKKYWKDIQYIAYWDGYSIESIYVENMVISYNKRENEFEYYIMSDYVKEIFK